MPQEVVSKVVLIHGGGKQITKLMEEKGIKAKFIDGLRVTTKEVISLVKTAPFRRGEEVAIFSAPRHNRLLPLESKPG